MDSRFLRSLIATIEHGSIAEAARAENLTAAAVSQRIQALERELGFALLSRQGHTATPTEACQHILRRARHIVHEVALLAGDADPQGLSGTLRIGAISTAMTDKIPAVLRHFSSVAPKVKPTLLPGTSKALYQAVLAGEIDAAILVAPPFALPKGLQGHVLGKEPLVLLSKLPPVDGVTAALQQAYLRYDPQAWGGRFGEQYLQDQGLQPEAICDLDALETIAMLVADGVGVSLVPHWPGLDKLAVGCYLTPVTEGDYARTLLLLHPQQPARPSLIHLLRQALQA